VLYRSEAKTKAARIAVTATMTEMRLYRQRFDSPTCAVREGSCALTCGGVTGSEVGGSTRPELTLTWGHFFSDGCWAPGH
jgi:hypothetical protein